MDVLAEESVQLLIAVNIVTLRRLRFVLECCHKRFKTQSPFGVLFAYVIYCYLISVNLFKDIILIYGERFPALGRGSLGRWRGRLRSVGSAAADRRRG